MEARAVKWTSLCRHGPFFREESLVRSTEAFTAKCRNLGMNPQKFGKTSWREILFEACDIIDRQAEEIKTLRRTRDPVKYPWQIHICKATKEEYIRALRPLLPHELVAQLKKGE